MIFHIIKFYKLFNNYTFKSIFLTPENYNKPYPPEAAPPPATPNSGSGSSGTGKYFIQNLT